MVKASVIILNWNGKEYLKDCFDSLQNQTYKNYEIILVDNGSVDSSVDFVRKNYPDVEVIRNNQNLGFAEGNNVGMRASRGEYVLTLNNDTKVEENWIEELVKAAQKDEKIGMCASKMLSFDGERIDSCGIYLKRRSGFAHDIGRGEDKNMYSKKKRIFGPCAGAALYKKKMLCEVGFFDRDYFAYLEDVDLAFRANLAGWRCVFVPSAIVYHIGSATGRKEPMLKLYLIQRNTLWNILKNYPLALLLKNLHWILGYNLNTILWHFKHEIRSGKVLIVLKAKFDALKALRTILKKRKEIQNMVRVSISDVEDWYENKLE